MTYDSIFLASASARRSQLLTQIGVRHESLPMDIDEHWRDGEPPLDYVRRLALGKAETAVRQLGTRADRPVLAADTTVVLDGRIFGKPVDARDAVQMLMSLAGRTHEVMTAVALFCGSTRLTDSQVSRVAFRALSAEECRRYWETGEPAGKAGAYAIQGLAGAFVARIEGSFSGVMGLPLYETAALLDAAGVRRWQAVA